MRFSSDRMPRTFVLKFIYIYIYCIYIYIIYIYITKPTLPGEEASPRQSAGAGRNKGHQPFCPKWSSQHPVCCFDDCSFLCDGYFWLVLAAPKSIWACIRMRFSSDRMPRTFVLKLIYIYILYIYIYNKARSSRR